MKMTARKVGVVLAIICATALVAPVAAGAKTMHATTQATSLKQIPVTGTARNGKAFTGHMTVTQFVTRNGKTFALGTLTGRLGNRRITAKQVALPVTVPTGTAPAPGMKRAAVTACPVLHLVLGPLDLNLLGLHVTLNQVVLDITAIPGAGNLLGNLLCSVSNLLNTQSILGQELTGLLNIVQQLVNTPVLQGL
jgi:hypothetical protein